MTWSRFQQHFHHYPEIGVSLDLSRLPFGDDFLPGMEPRMQAAFAAMRELERGAIANPDEGRMVGHYWLRAPHLAPNPAITGEIASTLAAVRYFTARAHAGGGLEEGPSLRRSRNVVHDIDHRDGTVLAGGKSLLDAPMLEAHLDTGGAVAQAIGRRARGGDGGRGRVDSVRRAHPPGGREAGHEEPAAAADIEYLCAAQWRTLGDPVQAQGIDFMQRPEFALRVPPAVGQGAEFFQFGRIGVGVLWCGFRSADHGHAFVV